MENAVRTVFKMISRPYYRLELCPTADGRVYYNNMILPQNENAGVDLFVSREYNPQNMVDNESATLLDLGCSARLIRVDPDGFEEEVHYWLTPRSSIIRTGMMMANSQGVIDRSYRGTLKAPVWVVARGAFLTYYSQQRIEGTRLFQIVAPDMGYIREVRVVQSLPETQRGDGGFGSTGVR